MILTDREIEAALRYKHISIDPSPSPEALSSTSVDLTLSRKFTTWNTGGGITISPGESDYDYAALEKVQQTVDQERFTMQPSSFVLAWSNELVSIPIHSRLAARVEGKSNLARLGIGVHVTAPTIHSGFNGPIQLEMFNFGPNKIELKAGMRICQLIFEQTLGTPSKGYQGRFQNQAPPQT